MESRALGSREHRSDQSAPPPTPLTATVGRDVEHANVLRAMTDHRLVTLVGPGGVGKTRLALDVARERTDAHRRGAIFVPLTRVTEDADVPMAIADAIGLRAGAGSEPSFRGAGALDALLVLDNCEHVIDAVSRVVPQLFDGGDRLHVLATSREPLAIGDEFVVALAPLPTDGPHAAAAELFRRRALAAGATEALEDRLVVGVVQQIDGLPLAVEMAAARLRTMSLGELARSIGDLDLLETSRRDVEPRHRTVRNLVAWSEHLLDEELRDALFDFTVFAGSVCVDDLAAVIRAKRPAETIARLVDRSLVMTVGTASGVRFVALDTVRSYGREQLSKTGREQEIRRRHARWFAEAAADIDRRLRTGDESAAFARFAEVFDELRLAVRWATEHDWLLAADLVHHSSRVGRMSLRDEVTSWACDLALRMPSDHPDSPAVLAAAAVGLSTMGLLGEARQLAEKSVELDPAGRGALHALEAMGDAALYEGRLDDSYEVARRIGECAERLGDPFYLDLSAVGMALSRSYAGRHAEALQLLAAAEPPQTSYGRSWFEYARGEALMEVDVTDALRHLDTAVDLARATGDRYLLEVSLLSASTLRARAGELSDAAEQFVILLDHFGLGGDLGHLVTTLRNLVTLLVRLGEHRAATELFGAVVDHPSSPSFGAERLRLDAAAEAAEHALGAAGYQAAVVTGGGRSAGDALAAAREVLLAARPNRSHQEQPVARSTVDAGEIQRDGDSWRVVFNGSAARIRNMKGLGDLAVLLSRPDTEVHALELMGGVDVGGSAGPLLDDIARREYHARIVELQQDIDEARADNDPGRAEKAERELDALVEQLSEAFGLGGKARTGGSSSERARSAVTFRIRSAIRKVAEQHPELGRHLENAVRTGTWCSYRPERPVSWHADPSRSP